MGKAQSANGVASLLRRAKQWREAPARRKTGAASVQLSPAMLARALAVMTAASITGSLLFNFTTNGNAQLLNERFRGIVDEPALLGAGRIRRASPCFVLEHTGQEVGGVAPVGHPEKIRTLLDESLKIHDLLWAGAGDHHSMFSITYEDLQRITEAQEMPVR